MTDESILSRRGELIGDHYILGDVLGVGGMGVVYTALQRTLQRTVAIKVPHDTVIDRDMMKAQFRTEALAGARISHRNVARVLELGDHHGEPFLVMEHVVGQILTEMLGGNPVTVLSGVRLARQLLSGLAEAHEAQVIHGDIKSDNVLVETRRDGSALPRLIDFGLARFADEPVVVLKPMCVAGTPEYLAPELIGGEPTTFASDVYAMGIVLYELLTGVTPFAGGTSQEVMARQRDCEAPRLSDTCVGIPAALDNVVARALSKNPRKRFANAAEFGDALARAELDVIEPSPEVVLPDRMTMPMAAVQRPTTVRARFAVGSTAPMRALVREPTNDEPTAVSGANADELVVAYLELARVLVDDHAYELAISELERGVALLTDLPDKRNTPVWRIQLLLAALYDGRGNRARACRVTRQALDQAMQTHSTLGQERASRLLDRLLHGPNAAHAGASAPSGSRSPATESS